MAGALYLFVITVLLLIALALAIPVLVNIVRDGLERRRKWKSGEMERYTEDKEYDAGPPAELDEAEGPSGTRICPNCDAENGAEFSYCQECAQRL